MDRRSAIATAAAFVLCLAWSLWLGTCLGGCTDAEAQQSHSGTGTLTSRAGLSQSQIQSNLGTPNCPPGQFQIGTDAGNPVCVNAQVIDVPLFAATLSPTQTSGWVSPPYAPTAGLTTTATFSACRYTVQQTGVAGVGGALILKFCDTGSVGPPSGACDAGFIYAAQQLACGVAAQSSGVFTAGGFSSVPSTDFLGMIITDGGCVTNPIVQMECDIREQP